MRIGSGIGVTHSAVAVPIFGLDPDQAIRELFGSGEVGAWYDPSDSSTVFQDAAGTTPAEVGDPVGLILDKSKGLTLGAELFSDFATEGLWTDNGNGSWSITNAATNTDLRSATLGVTGKRYVVSITFSNVSGILTFYPLHTSPIAVTSDGTYVVRQEANGGVISNGLWIRATTGSSATVSNISVKELPGNHATQTSSAARPILQQSGATPVLSGTELVTNGTFDTDLTGWSGSSGVSVSGSNQLEVTTIDSTDQTASQTGIPVTAGQTYIVSLEIVSGGGSGKSLVYIGDSGDLNRYISGYYNNGVHNFTVTPTANNLSVSLINAYNGAWTVVYDNISVQEVTSWSGGLRYLDFDGVDDYMGPVTLPSKISQPWTDAYAITFDAYTGGNKYVVDGLSAGERTALYGQNVQLIFYSGANYSALYSYPSSDVLVATRQGSGSEVRRNGSSLGIGNMGTHQLAGWYISNAYVPSGGYTSNIKWFGMLLINRTLTAGEITDLETYLAAKSGVTLSAGDGGGDGDVPLDGGK